MGIYFTPDNFKSTYKESRTETANRCGYCGSHIFLRFRDGYDESYKLNGKYICLSCLRKQANVYGVSVRDLIKR